MKVSEIMQVIRDETWLTTTMVSDSDLLKRVNFEYKKLWATIVNLDENYGWNVWIADLVQDSNEYTLLQSTSWYEETAGGTTVYTLVYGWIAEYIDEQTIYAAFNVNNAVNATLNVNTLGAKKIYENPTTQITAGYLGRELFVTLEYDVTLDWGNGGWLIIDKTIARYGIYKPEMVSVKYSTVTGTDWVLCDMRNWDNLDRDPTLYNSNQNYGNPFIVISDTSIFLYPMPTVDVWGGLKIQWVKRPYDLTSTMVENDILIPEEYHDILSFAVFPWAYMRRQLPDRKNEAINDFKIRRAEMMQDLSTRKLRPVQGYSKPLRNLE